MQFTVDGIVEILHWRLAWAGRVEVLQPAELKERLVENLDQAIAQKP